MRPQCSIFFKPILTLHLTFVAKLQVTMWPKPRALAVILAASLAVAQRCSITPPCQNPQKWGIDHIKPLKDAESGKTGCCPDGTEFDGINCVLSAPKCPENTFRDHDRCISRVKPFCNGGLDYVDGNCVTPEPPVCDGGTVLQGDHCVT